MSRTTVKAIWPGQRVRDLEELGNAWGSAPVVWESLSMQYLGWTSGQWLLEAAKGIDRATALWDLCKPGMNVLTESHAALLRMTFDRHYVVRADFARAARHIREFLADFPPTAKSVGFSHGINHWPRIAQIFESNPNVPAIGFHMTSVAEDPWEDVDWSTAFNIYC